MVINKTKSQEMIKLNGNTLKVVDNFKYLGVTLTNKLNSCNHTKIRENKCLKAS